MAKVFTITEGLENLGALKTGGQGSVYKGKRIGPIITAIKILPTPIYSESADDKNFISFQNEVQKLKKVNEHPNPNVVSILDSGITDSGNFPFIEMEYIEGPDLGELLRPPHEPVFTIKETIKVAEHLSNALAHCHTADVKHGDIKSNNVKFNKHTGNYILLDFGLSVMSDEQRRTSFRHAGAIEFMAPEQNEGQMLFQTDVYSYGVILFELLAGQVPFPLKDGGETSRNNVMVAHMENQPPDLLSLRRLVLPAGWNEEKKSNEMKVPTWLIDMIYKCLEKDPAKRFADGNELHQYIIQQSPSPENFTASKSFVTVDELQLKEQINDYRQQAEKQKQELDMLRSILKDKESELSILQSGAASYPVSSGKGVSMTAFITMLILTFALAGYAGYNIWQNRKAGKTNAALSQSTRDSMNTDSTSLQTNELPDPGVQIPDTGSGNSEDEQLLNKPVPPYTDTSDVQTNNTDEAVDNTTTIQEPTASAKGSGQYTVITVAHLHDAPDERTRRSAFITQSNGAILNSLDDQNGYIYVEFTNSQGQTSKGWLLKKDLRKVDE